MVAGKNGVLVGYARVSTASQNTDRQEMVLDGKQVEKIFLEKSSGKDTKRPKLQEMMNYIKEGDVVMVESVSGFARNVKDLLEMVEKLEKKGVAFVSIKERIDTRNNSITRKFILSIFGAMAAMERQYILDRQSNGIAVAKEKDTKFGRPAKNIPEFEEVYKQWKAKKITVKKITRQYGIARSTWYDKVYKYEKSNESNTINIKLLL